MDKPHVQASSNDDSVQPGASQAPNPALNVAFGGALGQTAGVPQLLNPFAAAAAAMAMAHSMQQPNVTVSSQQANMPFTVTNLNPVGGAPSAAAATNGANPSTNNNNTVPQQVPSNPVPQLPFLFQPQNAFAAALLGGGFLPGLTANPTSVALPAPAVQQQQQHVANNAVAVNGTTVAKTPKVAKKPRKRKKSAPKPPEPTVPRAEVAAAHAAAQVVAAHAASSGAVMANAMFANMQGWKLQQLESHVQLLRDTGQQIPHPVAILLADARRKEEKRTAKRAANRKSACSSRARKKALVEEMTKANARLRRQAMILALLPDLVIAITVDGKITFCSAQVERVLRHKIPHLVGANFANILTPSSRERLGQLVQELVAAEQAAALGTNNAAALPIAPSAKSAGAELIGPSSGQDVSSSGDANRVSEGSFPLAVVNCANEANSAEDNSDLSASGQGSGGKTEDATAQRGASPKSDSQVKSDLSSGSRPNQRAQAQQSSSDDSFSSSNLLKANEALDRNVRFHNEKLGKTAKTKPAHKDDVTGAEVTANNASARLSSLQVRSDPSPTEEATRKRKASQYDSLEEQYSSSSSDLMLDGIDKKKSRQNGLENSSEDSGYRESNQSVEDTSDDSSSLRNGPRPKPLAPACNICLIRDDLTTIWCEVTSSIRTRSLKDDNSDENCMGPLEAKAASSFATQSADASKSGDEQDPSSKGEVKELLLCLRPIRDGEETVDEALRFVPPKNVDLSDGLFDSADPSSASASVDDGNATRRPPKKRPIISEPSSSSLSNDSSKKRRLGEIVTEKSAVESLMLMGNNAK